MFNINLQNAQQRPFNSNDLKPRFAEMQSPAEVTSIPSPYATLHLFNLAFFAANAKQATTPKLYTEGMKEYLYDKAISHTLDIYELLFNWETLHLDQKGFSIEAFSIPSEDKIQENIKAGRLLQADGMKHKNFRSTLNLYIGLYKSKLHITTDDAFDCGYHIKYNDRIIAATSSLTGFFVSASTDFGLDGIKGIIPGNSNIVYLSNDDSIFRPLGLRDVDFRVFMCKFIQSYSPHSFQNDYFKDYINRYAEAFRLSIDYTNSTVDIKKYGFDVLSQIQILAGAIITSDGNNVRKKSNPQNIIAIPDRYNNIYFRSLINIKDNICFNLKDEDYKDDSQRTLLGQSVKWLSVKDFFEDNIVELEDAINIDRFYCCKVTDQNGNNADVKVLLPLKERYFKFFNFNDNNAQNIIEQRLEVRQISSGEYLATLKVPTTTGDVILNKEYSLAKANIVNLRGNSLYVGIFPFVKDNATANTNNGFFRIFTYNSKEFTADLLFYKDENNGMKIIENGTNNGITERHFSKKMYDHSDFQEFPKSTFYALETTYFDKDRAYTVSGPKDVNFDIIKILVTKDNIVSEAIIIPKFIQKECNGNSGMLSVDFGTSNTNISIGTDGATKKVSDYDTYISDSNGNKISQIVMLHKPNGQVFDFESTNYGGTNQNHFLSEFLPTIIHKDQEHFKFSLPSVINLHEDRMSSSSVSLVHANIPVAYYSRGLRKLKGKNIDKPFANFKWIGTDRQKPYYVYLFIDQLLFMARNALLALGQNPRETIVTYSTPLSMKNTEQRFYEDLWNALSKKYFGGYDMDNGGKYTQNSKLHSISESRSPYYASGHQFGADSSILLDVGGGSTDILFYQNNMVQATTSYAYAANALFAGDRRENIFMKLMPAKKEEGADMMNEVEKSQIMSVCDVFNYRFTKKEQTVIDTFAVSSEWDYLLVLHCSAILYHAIQNNKAILGNTIQLRNILFSGNGSKLFKILNEIGDDRNNKNFEKLAKSIVQYVYGMGTSSLQISFVDEKWSASVEIDSSVGMKAATSIGSICWKMNLRNDGGMVVEPKVVPIGDAANYLKTQDLKDDTVRDKWDAGDSTKQSKIIQHVGDNFINFLDGFLGVNGNNSLFGCGLRTFIPSPINADVIRKLVSDDNLIENSIKDYHLIYPMPEHSIFFVPLQKLIIELSKYFAGKQL